MQSKGIKKASTEFRVGAKELEARGCRAEMQLVPCEGKWANWYSYTRSTYGVSRYRLEVSIRSLELDASSAVGSAPIYETVCSYSVTRYCLPFFVVR